MAIAAGESTAVSTLGAAVAASEARRCVITAVWGLYAPQVLTPPAAVFLPGLQGVRTVWSTRNQCIDERGGVYDATALFCPAQRDHH
jgi:hypothetical protein